MTSRYSTTLQILALTTALGAGPTLAQDAQQEPVTIELLLELAANNAVDDALNLPSAELGAVLAAASDAQLSQLVASLSPAQADALVASVAQSGTGPENVAKVVTAAIRANPGSAARIVAVVRANTAPVALERIAESVAQEISRGLADQTSPNRLDLQPATVSDFVEAAIALDARSAGAVVQIANDFPDTGSRITETLAAISQNTDPQTASAIENAVAATGGLTAQRFSDARGEVTPAAVAPAPAPVPVADTPPEPTPPAEIGGAGATPGGTSANDAGSPTQVASNSPSTGGGTPAGGGATPGGTPTPVSPTN